MLRFLLAGAVALVCFRAEAMPRRSSDDSCPAAIAANWSYRDVLRGRTTSDGVRVALPNLSRVRTLKASDPALVKTFLILNLLSGVREHLERFHAIPEGGSDDIPLEPMRTTPRLPTVMPPRRRPRPQPAPEPDRSAYNQLADSLVALVDKLETEGRKHPEVRSDNKVGELFDLTRKLADNIRKGRQYSPFLELAGARGGILAMAASASPGLTVTTGGVQNAGHFRKLVEGGSVPEVSDLKIDGFLKEFNLTPNAKPTDRLIAVQPTYVFDPVTRKLYVQLGMNSNVTEESFTRPPVNLVIALDISGSMSAEDGTGQSRLAWAKKALTEAVNNLGPKDVLSVVLFDEDSEIFLKPQHVTSRARTIAAFAKIQTRGSTDVHKALAMAYDQARVNKARLGDEYLHRVLLISDAGHNAGPWANVPGELLREVEKGAAEGIGLTGVGMGENFKDDLIDLIANSRGGNYLFVQNGRELHKLHQRFKFLITPIAYQFQAQVALEGVGGTLVEAYGVNHKPGTPLAELRYPINVATLSFAGEDEGGAIVLVFQIGEKPKRVARRTVTPRNDPADAPVEGILPGTSTP